MANAAVLDKLVQVAKARKTISYGDLAQAADLSLDNDEAMKSLGFWLD